jgi:hypothetical protein
MLAKFKKKLVTTFANGFWLKTVSKCPSSAPLFLTVVYTFLNPSLLTVAKPLVNYFKNR